MVVATSAAVYSTDSFRNSTDFRGTTDAKFLEIYQKALDLNKNRFKDVNLIQIGDTVLFPAAHGSGTEAWIANYPSDGKHDCIWLLTGKYLAGQLVTVPVDTIRIKATEKQKPSAEESAQADRNGWWLILFILAVIALAVFLTRLFTRRPADLNRNPVIPGGLSDIHTTALQQINVAYPNRPRAIRIQRGIIRSPFGIFSVSVRMTFANGQREVSLMSGETAYRVEREGGVVDYYRQHCGNLFGEISQGGYNLPEGWTFVAAVPTTEIPRTPASVSDEEFKLEPSGAETTAIIQALSKLSVPPRIIMYGDLLIKFQKEKKVKAEKK